MKDFSKMVLATIVGVVVTTIVFGVLLMMSIVGMVASDSATVSPDKHSVLVIPLSGIIDEQSYSNPITSFIGNDTSTQGLDEILAAIDKAAKNDKIDAIYLEAGALATGYATLLEIRNALLEFKKTGKKIIAYGDIYTQGAYYLASVADNLYMNPSGQVDIHGISSQTMYVRDLYAKFGVRFQVIKVGTYKSATEMYTEDHMSDANREQVMKYITGLWDNVSRDISASRRITVDRVNELADTLTMMLTAEEAVEEKLVDGLLYYDDLRAEVKKILKLEADEDIAQISVAEMQNVKSTEKHKGGEIAIYYASGSIYDEPLSGFSTEGSQIVGSTVASDLEALAEDDEIKAVVLRVNSPGGSAYASEQIWHAVTQLKEKKPVVVSMGDYAASGGYYISCNASWIVAQPTTLTGSIGIFGVIPEASELLQQKLGLHFDEAKTNRHAAFGGAGVMGFLARPFNADELEMMQTYINRGYELFRKRVADGRKQEVETIEAIAQGRVWIGEDALKNHLVDELGGIEVAIAKAAKLANLTEYYTTSYPGVPDFLDELINSATSSNGNYLDEQMRLTLGEFYQPFMTLRAIGQQSPIQASLPLIMSVK